jgi:hypothetical protein
LICFGGFLYEFDVQLSELEIIALDYKKKKKMDEWDALTFSP